METLRGHAQLHSIVELTTMVGTTVTLTGMMGTGALQLACISVQLPVAVRVSFAKHTVSVELQYVLVHGVTAVHTANVEQFWRETGTNEASSESFSSEEDSSTGTTGNPAAVQLLATVHSHEQSASGASQATTLSGNDGPAEREQFASRPHGDVKLQD